MKYKQLKLIYEKLYALSLEVKEKIDKKFYHDIMPILQRKNSLLTNLQQTKKILKEKEYPEFIKELENKLKNQELENIKRLDKLKNELKIKKNKLNKDIKLMSAYSQKEYSPKIVDISE